MSEAYPDDLDLALVYFSKCRVELDGLGLPDLLAWTYRDDTNAKLSFMQHVLNHILVHHREMEQRVVIGGLRLVGDPASQLAFNLFAEDAAPALQHALIASIVECFCAVFAVYCEPVLIASHGKNLPPWAALCFIWWDALPRHGVPYRRYLHSVDLDLLDGMKTILHLDHLACKESALHGLGHWHVAYPDEVKRIISECADVIAPALAEYARQASIGHVE